MFVKTTFDLLYEDTYQLTSSCISSAPFLVLPECSTTTKSHKNVNCSFFSQKNANCFFFLLPTLIFFLSFQMTWLKMKTRPCETEFPTWKKGSMTKMTKLPVYALHWLMHYGGLIRWNQQKVRYTKRERIL